MPSQILSGLQARSGLNAQPFAEVRTGVCMSPENLALLKTLAIRPSASVAVNVRAMIEALERSGYVANGPHGWSTTAKGCELIERHRAVGAPLGSRNEL